MPHVNSQESANDDVERLFLQEMVPAIPKVVGQVFAKLGRHPDPAEADRFAQRIRVLLWENDYRVLRSFKRQSAPETWLFTIAMRHIRRWLRGRDGIVSLDDMPSDSFTVQPDQEESLLEKERDEILLAARAKLTKREQEMFDLWWSGLSIEDIAEKMRIKRRSASVRKRTLIKKLQRIIGEE